MRGVTAKMCQPQRRRAVSHFYLPAIGNNRRDSTSRVDFLLRGLHHAEQRTIDLALFAYQKSWCWACNEFVWLLIVACRTLGTSIKRMSNFRLDALTITIHADSAVTNVIKFFDHYGLGGSLNTTWRLGRRGIGCCWNPKMDEIWPFDNVMIISQDPKSDTLNPLTAECDIWVRQAKPISHKIDKS